MNDFEEELFNAGQKDKIVNLGILSPGALIHGENCKSWHGQLHTEENPVYRNVLKTQNP